MFFSMLWDGKITVELISADIQGFLAVMQRAGYTMWELEKQDELTICFKIHRSAWGRLRKLCAGRGEQLRILSHHGYYWHFRELRKRPILLIGMILLLWITLWVPGKVFFVRIEGNSSVPSRQIAAEAAKCGITFGATRSEVRSEKVKNALLEAIPSLSWAGINTYGCTAVITVKERSTASALEQEHLVSSIIAIRDGIIGQITVLRGNALCQVGDAVKAGQVLISGYSDCGLRIQAQQAQGEIFAQTSHSLRAISPIQYVSRGKETEKTQKISLIIGKKRINFTNSSGISGTLCAKIYEENYVSLPGGFVLPVAIAVETWTCYETTISESQLAEQLLRDDTNYYLQQQMVGGSILSAEESFALNEEFLVLTGSYQCYEMIGITRIEENIPDYVKND